jgi:hypothetical protein
MSSGQPKILLKHEFLKFVMGIWSSAMLAHVLGHSFCIGGAVKLLLAGVPPEIIAATGGWTSLAFLLYWRRMEEILPMSTSKAYNKAHIDDLPSLNSSVLLTKSLLRLSLPQMVTLHYNLLLPAA